MRLRYLLPAIELLASVCLVIVPLWHYSATCCTVRTSTGEQRIVWHDNPPKLPSLFGIDAVTFAKGVNLPAAPIVLPILLVNYQYRNDSRDWLHDPVWNGIGFALSGVAVWFFVGRFIDDVLGEHAVGSAGRVFDLLFASTTALTATMTLFTPWSTSGLPDREKIWFGVWIFLWAAAGYSGMVIRAIQFVRAKLKVKES